MCKGGQIELLQARQLVHGDGVNANNHSACNHWSCVPNGRAIWIYRWPSRMGSLGLGRAIDSSSVPAGPSQTLNYHSISTRCWWSSWSATEFVRSRCSACTSWLRDHNPMGVGALRQSPFDRHHKTRLIGLRDQGYGPKNRDRDPEDLARTWAKSIDRRSEHAGTSRPFLTASGPRTSFFHHPCHIVLSGLVLADPKGWISEQMDRRVEIPENNPRAHHPPWRTNNVLCVTVQGQMRPHISCSTFL